MPRVLILGLIVCVLSASSCGTFKKLLSRKQKPATEDTAKETFVGTVESVNPEQKFVLVRTDLRVMIAPGTKLESRAQNGSRALLTVTPERKMSFLSADISEGTPSAGDIVFLPEQSVSAVPTLQADPSASSPPPPPEPAGVPAPTLRLPQY